MKAIAEVVPVVVRDLVRARRVIAPGVRRAVELRDGARCRYCGEDANWGVSVNGSLAFGRQFDHIVPIAQGGESSVTNVVVACFKCNQRKRAQTPEQAGMQLRPEPR